MAATATTRAEATSPGVLGLGGWADRLIILTTCLWLITAACRTAHINSGGPYSAFLSALAFLKTASLGAHGLAASFGDLAASIVGIFVDQLFQRSIRAPVPSRARSQ